MNEETAGGGHEDGRPSVIELPALSADAEPTRQTLHAYTRAIAAVPHAHGIAHPKWWHLSLAVRPEGLVTDSVPLPNGAALSLGLDVHTHDIVVVTSAGAEHRIDMRSGATATEVGDEVIEVVGALGLDGGFDRSRFEDDSPREYDPASAGAYFEAFTVMAGAFESHRVTLGERVGPVQLWPHGFDLAFEWFGTKTAVEDGEELPGQINLGFYPGQEPYVYSSPWPFDERLVDRPLPHGAVWNTEGWQGAMLPYGALREGDTGAMLSDFARAVFDAASPGLLAD